MQLANALHFAHSQGVLHRDLKPANVLLDTDGTVWLTDFGLAQAADDPNLTRSGDIVGTLRYLAPEWLRGECSRQSDVYGLGITLYALVTFAPAFAENDRATLIHQIVQQNPKRPRSINHNVPRDLETIILKAIEKEATRRYASAGALADDLSRFLGDRPIRASRVVLVEQAWRWCRRNPVVTTPDGRLLIAGTEAGLEFWDLAERSRIATIKQSFTKQLYFDSIRNQLTCMTMPEGIQHVPIELDGLQCRNVGKPQARSPYTISLPWGRQHTHCLLPPCRRDAHLENQRAER